MKFTVEKLDRRYNGSLLWKHRLCFTRKYTENQYDTFRYFHQFRIWMTETYGPSCERDLWTSIALGFQVQGGESFAAPWCWHTDRDSPGTQYIYIKDDTILSNITLKWTV